MATLRALLADAGRVLAHEGQGDYVAGHVSLKGLLGAAPVNDEAPAPATP